jgi:tRNA(Arg) A34 adenosine deaminase TadA
MTPSGSDSTQNDDPQALLQRAVRLARDNAAAGQLPFGALVVRDGAVLATGVNTAIRDRDPTAHAEVAAIRAACRAIDAVYVTGATVISSCEPCAMCHAVAAATGVERIVYAAPREYVPDLGFPAPPEVAELMVRMQDVLRAATPAQLEYVETDGADEPFRRFLAGGAG